jgi:signal peptidase II
MSGKTRKDPQELAFFLAGAIVLCLIDRLTKVIAVSALSGTDTVPLIKGFLHLTLVYNTGGAFGIFNSNPLLFAVISSLAVVVILFIYFTGYDRIRLSEKIALLLIVSGAAGNLIDRVTEKHVIDFIDLRIWPVFNFADCCITAGVSLIAVLTFFRPVRK